MKFKEFKEEVKRAYAKRFPDSACEVRIFKCLGKSITIDCYLAKDSSEVSFGIIGNDMFVIAMMIDLPRNFGDDDDLPEKLTLEWQESFIKVKPENDWIVSDIENVSHRKTTGDAKKIVKALDKYFQRVYDTTKKMFETGRVHDNYADLVSRKLVW